MVGAGYESRTWHKMSVQNSGLNYSDRKNIKSRRSYSNVTNINAQVVVVESHTLSQANTHPILPAFLKYLPNL